MNWEQAQLWTSLTCLAIVLAGFGFLELWHASRGRVPKTSDPLVWLAMTFGLILFVTFFVGQEPWSVVVVRQLYPIALGLGFLGMAMSWIAIYRKRETKAVHRSAQMGVVASVFMILVLSPCLFTSGLSLPREAARHSQCRGHLKLLALAMHNYHDLYKVLPSYKSGDPAVSWRVNLLPFIDESALAKKYDTTKAWDHSSNLTVGQTQINAYQCPSDWTHDDTDDAGRYFTSYVVPVGKNAAFRDSRSLNFQQITDGMSQTIMVMEACGEGIVWTEPRDRIVKGFKPHVRTQQNRDQSDSVVSSFHERNSNVSMADGSLRSVSAEIDPDVLRHLLTADGGERIDDDEF